MQTKIPPPLYMLAFSCLMYFLNRYIPILVWLLPPENKIGLVIIFISVMLDLWSLILFFIARTTPNPLTPDKTRSLVTTGLYRISRNPMYLGLLLMLIGWALYLGSVSPLLLLPLFVFTLNKMQIEPEERLLKEKFGEGYIKYQRRVRRWL
jgi:protein-S-isoprenylcysteine O-methyltransferase Ste14